jgi:kumamolisin
MMSFNEAFAAAAAMGISVFVASGDTGSTDQIAGNVAYVDFPASCPFVTSCGGTRLVSGTMMETVWNNGPNPRTGGGSGGGISHVFPVPVYQTGPGINLPPSINPPHHPGRGVPDICGNADPNTGYRVRVDGKNIVVGGTSAVAPLWAGLFARINQSLGRPAGFANTLLYSVVSATPGALRDITHGNNDLTGRVGGYRAGPGWDPCSGLGSPGNGALIMQAIAS